MATTPIRHPQLVSQPASTRPSTPNLLASGAQARASPSYLVQNLRPNPLFCTPKQNSGASGGIFSPIKKPATPASAAHPSPSSLRGLECPPATEQRKRPKQRTPAFARALTEHDQLLLKSGALLPRVYQQQVARISTVDTTQATSGRTPSRDRPLPILVHPTPSSPAFTAKASEHNRGTRTTPFADRPFSTPISDLDELPRTARSIPRRFIAPRPILPLSALRPTTSAMFLTTGSQPQSPARCRLRPPSTNPPCRTQAKTGRSETRSVSSLLTMGRSTRRSPAVKGTQIPDRCKAREVKHQKPSPCSLQDEDDKLYDLYRDPIPVLTPGLERKAMRDKLGRKAEREARQREQEMHDRLMKTGRREDTPVNWDNGEWLERYAEGELWPAVDRKRDVSVDRALERNRSRSGKWRKMGRLGEVQVEKGGVEILGDANTLGLPLTDRAEILTATASSLGQRRKSGSAFSESVLNCIEKTPPVAHSTLRIPGPPRFPTASPTPPTTTCKMPVNAGFDIPSKSRNIEMEELSYRLRCVECWVKGMKLKLAAADLSSEWETITKVLEEEVNRDYSGDWGFGDWILEADLTDISKDGGRI